MDATHPKNCEERLIDLFNRIAALNPSLNAFTTLFEQEALSDARRLDEQSRQGHIAGPLHGIPISVKDLIDVRGSVTTAASKVHDPHPAGADAPCVASLRKAGAIIFGKCNLHEFALGTTNDESAFGPAHNPRDPSRSPGGSSGGSAAAVAAGLGWGSVGTDTGGSVRIPAAACGVVGLKPTFGEISTRGVLPLSVSLDHVGPLATTVRDAWQMYAVMAGRALAPALPGPVAHIRLGRLSGYFLDALDRDVRQLFDEAIGRLSFEGVSLVDVELPGTDTIASTYIDVSLPEAAAVHARRLERAWGDLSSGVRTRLEMGREIPADRYLKGQQTRGILRDAVDRALRRCDALVLPTLPIPAPLIGATTAATTAGELPVRGLMLRLTQLFNLTGHPAISLPCGDTPGGLPAGLQLVGMRGQTEDLLAAALSCEAHVSPHGR
jgi:aspartyl-tRNA(Asn)/glutamyl-tRNA(Gln) amidotransferase subunit A